MPVLISAMLQPGLADIAIGAWEARVNDQIRTGQSGTDLGYPATRCTYSLGRPLALLATDLAGGKGLIINGKVSAYALATPCPVLTYSSYALAARTYGATEIKYGAPRVLCDVRYSSSVWPYARATRCPVLTYIICYQAASHGLGRSVSHAGDVNGYAHTRVLRGVRLRARYAMSGTHIAYAATVLRDFRYRHKLCCYETRSFAVLSWPMLLPRLRACYAMSGTETAYGALQAYARAMRCPVLTCRMVCHQPTRMLRDVRY
eukprot:1847475-Rhodomonas_salina.4